MSYTVAMTNTQSTMSAADNALSLPTSLKLTAVNHNAVIAIRSLREVSHFDMSLSKAWSIFKHIRDGGIPAVVAVHCRSQADLIYEATQLQKGGWTVDMSFIQEEKPAVLSTTVRLTAIVPVGCEAEVEAFIASIGGTMTDEYCAPIA